MKTLLKVVHNYVKNKRRNAKVERHNQQYLKGKWKDLDQEWGRYTFLAAIHGRENLGGKILELGAGEGHLLSYLHPFEYSEYLGVDVSDQALKHENFKKINIQTIHSDIHDFIPTKKYDTIVYNEVLYYLQDPVEVINRYNEYLTPNGIHLISIWQSHQDLVDKIHQNFNVWRDKILERTLGGRWHILVIKKKITQLGAYIFLLNDIFSELFFDLFLELQYQWAMI